MKPRSSLKQVRGAVMRVGGSSRRCDQPKLRVAARRHGHALILAYTSPRRLPPTKAVHLHVRFAAWLKQRGPDVTELEEILGYHLEQAIGYRAELGLPRDEELATAASRHLTSAARRAYHYGLDHQAAVKLLQRAAAVLPPGHIDLAIEMTLIDARSSQLRR